MHTERDTFKSIFGMEMWAFKLLNYYIIVSIIISNIITFGSTNPEYVLHLGFRIIYSL